MPIRFICALILFHCAGIITTSSLPRNIEWIELNPESELSALNLDPAGFNRTNIIYVCRAKSSLVTDPNEAYWVPGQLMSFNDRSLGCWVGENGTRYIHFDNVQVLLNPRAFTSWYPIPQGFQCLPPHLIAGGYHQNGEVAYICRHFDENGRLMVGKYSHAQQGCLHVWGVEHVKLTNIELLMINRYGRENTIINS